MLELSSLRSTEVYDRSIDLQKLRLRRKIEKNPARPELIKTERGLGYRFCASVGTVHSEARQDLATRRERQFMYTIVRHMLALAIVIASGGSLAAESAVGKTPSGADTAGSGSQQSGYDAERGRALYLTHCSACHGADGEGHSGTYPPIEGSGVVTRDDATKHIQVVLNGLQGGRAGGVMYTTPMPPFGGILNDVDAANIIDYERSAWGNHGKLVVPAQVAAQRDHSK